MLHGHPITTRLPEDPGFSERFWYWRGSSGRDYIHSIYRKDSCPPLTDAVVVLVRGAGGRRQAVSVGRIGRDSGRSATAFPGWHDADEVHVHLLARESGLAVAIERDLALAMHEDGLPSPGGGFAEAVQPEFVCSI